MDLEPHVSERMADLQLNCQGMNCPMPIVELTRAARTLESGQEIEVTATDLAFKPDLEAWSRRMGHVIASFESDNEVQTAVVRLGQTTSSQ